ncbi:hypothetical protein FS837_006712 [Tulasnella sp. UAMH 9824]|nr:hypothetical protein FS837_006712 [Tulasnella sp. UAMH 9824]
MSHNHGMDGMDMGDGSSSTGMVMYLHFNDPLADTLWFKGWTPGSEGALVGACIGLFLLALVERLLAGMRGVMEAWWRKKTGAILVRTYSANGVPQTRSSTGDRSSVEQKGEIVESMGAAVPPGSPVTSRTSIRRVLPPFIPSHELARATFHVTQAFVGYGLMLAVMTFNASYIISILVGSFTGELLFGRFAQQGHHA